MTSDSSLILVMEELPTIQKSGPSMTTSAFQGTYTRTAAESMLDE